MVDRRTVLVNETVPDVVDSVIEYRRRIVTGQHLHSVPGTVR